MQPSLPTNRRKGHAGTTTCGRLERLPGAARYEKAPFIGPQDRGEAIYRACLGAYQILEARPDGHKVRSAREPPAPDCREGPATASSGPARPPPSGWAAPVCPNRGRHTCSGTDLRLDVGVQVRVVRSLPRVTREIGNKLPDVHAPPLEFRVWNVGGPVRYRQGKHASCAHVRTLARGPPTHGPAP